MDEIWKDIEDWPFHQVSNLGRVRVLPGGKVHRRLITEIELRRLTPANGYTAIAQSFYDDYGYYQRKHYVHILVLNAFVGPCPEGQECRHLNGNRSDNRWPENIAWGTHYKNMEDMIRHGTSPQGERNPNSKLTEYDVVDIRSRPKSRGVIKQLVKQYGVSKTMILDIRRGKFWKHVDVDYKKSLSMKPVYLIPDMEPIEIPQMTLSFGA